MSWYDDTDFRRLGAKAFKNGYNRYDHLDELTEGQQDEFRRGWLSAEREALDDAEEVSHQKQFQHFDSDQETFNDF
jgi:hypothetical protein